MHNALRNCIRIGLLTLPALTILSVSSVEANGFTPSANVALTSDYVWRGISQTNEEPAIQGGFDVSHESGFYAGVWGSNVEFGDSAQLEVDLYLGFSKTFSGGLSFDIGAIHYEYPGAWSSLDYDFQEYALGIGYTIQKIALGVKGSYAPEFTGSEESAYYLEGDISYKLPANITIMGHYGYSDGDAYDDNEYSDYKLSIATEIAGFGLDLSGYGTDIDGDNTISDERVVITLSKSF